MEPWDDLKAMIRKWVRLEITGEEFRSYLTNNEFETASDKEVARRFLEILGK